MKVIPEMLMREVLEHQLSCPVHSKSRLEQHKEGTTSNHPKKKNDFEFDGLPDTLEHSHRCILLEENLKINY